MTTVIETNIPMPDSASTWKAKLDALPVGGSFKFPRNKRNSVRQNVSAYFHVETEKRFKISCRKGDIEARVWRKEDSSDAG